MKEVRGVNQSRCVSLKARDKNMDRHQVVRYVNWMRRESMLKYIVVPAFLLISYGCVPADDDKEASEVVFARCELSADVERSNMYALAASKDQMLGKRVEVQGFLVWEDELGHYTAFATMEDYQRGNFGSSISIAGKFDDIEQMYVGAYVRMAGCLNRFASDVAYSQNPPWIGYVLRNNDPPSGRRSDKTREM